MVSLRCITVGDRVRTTPKLRIEPITVHQLLMTALLDHVAVSQYNDQVRVEDRTQSMRDEDASSGLVLEDAIDVG